MLMGGDEDDPASLDFWSNFFSFILGAVATYVGRGNQNKLG